MEEQNMFLWIKAAVTALCAAFSAAFGWLGWLVLAWAVCMVIDWISGSAAAASKGEWSSAVARAGIWHKAGMVVVVIVAAMADGVLGVAVENLPVLGIQYTVLILPVVLVWYIFTELGSIAENAAAMGAPVPEGLIKLLAAGKRAAEKCVPDTETHEKNCQKNPNAGGGPVFWGGPPLFCMCGRMGNGGNSALPVQAYIQAYESLHDFLGGKNVAGKNKKRRRFNDNSLNPRRFWSGIRVSNSPPTAWEAVTLPDELIPHQ